MGKIITLATRELFETQDFVFEGRIREILTKVVNQRLEEIPPICVRKSQIQEVYGILDGHHRAIIYDLIQLPIRCWEAEHKEDYMPIEEFPLDKGDRNTRDNFYHTNRLIFRRFEFFGNIDGGCKRIPEFRKDFPYLRTLEDAKAYLQID